MLPIQDKYYDSSNSSLWPIINSSGRIIVVHIFPISMPSSKLREKMVARITMCVTQEFRLLAAHLLISDILTDIIYEASIATNNP
jgi:hypothetical protein